MVFFAGYPGFGALNLKRALVSARVLLRDFRVIPTALLVRSAGSDDWRRQL